MAAEPGERGVRDPREGGRSPATPPQVTMGLLDYVTAYSVDEDYAHASASRPSGRTAPSRRGGSVLVLVVFGLLLATAAAQTARAAPDRSSSRQSLVTQVVDLRDELQQARRGVARTRAAMAAARQASRSASLALSAAQDEIARLGPVVGTVAVTGPGLRIVVDDNPDAVDQQGQVSDKDLQRLVNGLWVAGAEAVSVNARRITSLTAIRQAGEAITVNFKSLRRPYTVLAVGNPATLPARFVDSAGGSYWLDVEAVFGLRFDMTTESSVTLPAVPLPSLRYANQSHTESAQQPREEP